MTVYGKKIGKVLAVINSTTGKAESLEKYANKKAPQGGRNTKESV